MPLRLINRESENLKPRDDGTWLWVPKGWGYQGEPIPERKMMMLQSGTTNHPCGRGVGRLIYSATYLIEKTVELMLDSVEEFGRPIPVVYMPKMKDALTKREREEIRAYARAVHSRFIEVPTSEMNAKIDIGNAALASSGQIGGREMAIIEMLVTWIYVAVIRVAQTMNKTGGSRALEDTRYDITDDASRPLCHLLDDGLNKPTVPGDPYTGALVDFLDFNFPNDPVEELCHFETPTLSQEDISAHHRRTMEAIDRGLGGTFSADQYLRITGIEKAKNADDELGGVPQTRVTKTTSDDLDQDNETKGEPQSLSDVVRHMNALNKKMDRALGLLAA